MTDDSLSLSGPIWCKRVRERTAVRLLQRRAGASYRTTTQIELREAHAARDAIRAELNTEADLGRTWFAHGTFLTLTRKPVIKTNIFCDPVLDRRFCEASRQAIAERCSKGSDPQIVIGDGLSVAAVSSQMPALLPLLKQGAQDRGLSIGQAFVVHHYCQVGIRNEIGELLDLAVAVLLIGERPGLATAESLSAYMAYRPRQHHSEANRNLVSNIHSRGVNSAEAAKRILNLAAQMMRGKVSRYTCEKI